MALIQIRLEDELKDRAQELYDQLGLDLSTAIRMFLKKSISINGIPFPLINDDRTCNSNSAIWAMKAMHEQAVNNGYGNMTLEEINQEIEEVRFERNQSR